MGWGLLLSYLQVNVGISEQYDPHWPVMGGSSPSALSEVQEPHHLGRPGPPQHYISLQPRYSPFCLSITMIVSRKNEIILALKKLN